MRKCNNCGVELKDTDMICSKCQSDDLSEIIIKNSVSRKRVASVLGITAIIAAIAAICGYIGWYIMYQYIPAQPVKTGVYALISGDIEGCIDTMHESFRNDFETIYTSVYGDAQQYSDAVKSELSSEYGDDYEIDVTVIDVSTMSKEMLDALNSELTSKQLQIQDAKYVAFKTHISGSNGCETVSARVGYSVKIDGSWYFYESINSGEE